MIFSDLSVRGIVQSGLLLLCDELTLFCIKLPENFMYLNQSELSNFFMYLISSKASLLYLVTQYFHSLSSKFLGQNLDFD